MFWRKKPSPETTIEDEWVTKKSIRRMDKVVTGVILGGLIASIYGVKRLRHKDEDHVQMIVEPTPIKRKSFFRWLIGK
jgi:hypothetical protein